MKISILKLITLFVLIIQFSSLAAGQTSMLQFSSTAVPSGDGPRSAVLIDLDRDGWMEVVERMRDHPFGNPRSLRVSDQQRDEIVDYLASHYGPEVPPLEADPEFLSSNWARGEASKFMITEYDLPPGAAPHDVAADSEGNGWVAEDGHGVLGRFDPRTLTYTRFPIPPGPSKPTAHTMGVDPQDRLWVPDAANGRVVQYDPKTGQFTFYPVPKPAMGRFSVNTFAFLPDGSVWMTEPASNQILRLDPATKKIIEYPVPSGVRAKRNSHPYGMAVDGKQWLWFAQRDMDKVAQVDPQSGEITEYDVPTKNSEPKRMGTDLEGNIWFGEFAGLGKLARIDYRTGEVTEYQTPTKYSGAYSVDVDKRTGYIWVSEMMADKIARFDPKTKTFVEYPMPTHFSEMRKIQVDPSRANRVWFGGYNHDQVGYLDVIE